MKKLALIFISASLLLSSCDMEEKRWQKANEKNTIEDYIAFQEKYPQSSFDSIAFDKIIELEWNSLKESDSIEQFITFQESYSINKYSDTISSLAEQAKMISYTKAIQLGDNDRVLSIINYDSSLVQKENILLFAYMLAADNCQLELLKFFNQHISDVNIYNVDGTTALHHAVKNGCVNMVNYLIENGADVNKMVKEVSYLSGFSMGSGGVVESFGFGQEDNEPELYGSPLLWAAKFDQYDIAKVLIENGADVNKNTDEESTILEYASETGNPQFVKLLFTNDAKWHYMEKDKQPIFHSKNNEIIQLYLDKGEKLNLNSKYHGTPLHYAAYRGFDSAISYYLSKKNNPDILGSWFFWDIYSTTQLTPIWLAAYGGHLETIKLLEKNKADINFIAKSDRLGGSLLHAAAMNGNVDVMNYLISKIPDIDLKCNIGEISAYRGTFSTHIWKDLTPLSLAAQFGNLEVVKILSEKGADINYCNSEDWSVLDFAIFESHDKDIVNFLLARGANLAYEIERIDNFRTTEEIKEILREHLH